MNHLSESTKKWLQQVVQQSHHIDAHLLSQACTFVEGLNDKIVPSFADNILNQGLAIAQELLPLNADSETLATAISYPAVYYGSVDLQTIEKQLGASICKMLKNTQRIGSAQSLLKITVRKKIDNLRKMLLAMIDDIRIVFIKLAECLAILKYLYQNDIVEKQAFAQQTFDIYAPLANSLGIGKIQWQLEDLAFQILNKEQYTEIKKFLKVDCSDREQYITHGIGELKQLLEKEAIKDFSVSGRAKHIFSIYKKMQVKQLSFEGLYDFLAFRILVPNIEDCYTVLGSIHSQWSPIQTEFSDYIAKPKSNGYQSIHTAVRGPNRLNIEIQIRTHQMHHDAECGSAAHWKYKENSHCHYEEKINRLRHIMKWQEQNHNTSENLYSKVFEDRVYVLTPQGDVFDLAAGATPLDFAYCLHTEVGHRCRGAKINGALVPLTYKLNTGDCIEIITSQESKPSRDWLPVSAGYLTTHQARQKVALWFKKSNFKYHLEKGHALWEKYYRRGGLKKSDINKAYQAFNFKTSEALMAALGRGDLGIVTVVNYLKNQQFSIAESSPELNKKSIDHKKQHPIKKTTDSHLVVAGINNVLASIAKCCKPIPGDCILSYVTQGHGVTIHNENCHNIQQAMIHRSERILSARWGTEKTDLYPVNILIEASDRSGLLGEIATIMAYEKIPIVSVQSQVDRSQDCIHINFTIEVRNKEALNKLLLRFHSITSVINARRI